MGIHSFHVKGEKMSNRNQIITTISIIFGIIVACITIFTFITGVTTLGLFKGRATAETYTQPTQAPVNPFPTSKQAELPNQVAPSDCLSSAGQYQAGTPICADGLILSVDPDAIHLLDKRI